MKKLFFILQFCFISFAFAQNETLFKFKYKEGDNFSLISNVVEDVKVNGRLNHKAQIISRVSEKVEKVDENGRGFIKAKFMTSENSTSSRNNNSTYKWGENFQSEFWRSEKGVFEINENYFMPVIRDLPVFPDKPLKIGDEWSADGYEAEDLRRDLNVTKPFKVPFIAKYKYVRDEEGFSKADSSVKKTFQVIEASYSLYYETPLNQNEFQNVKSDFPVTTMGYSFRTIWWDNEKGQIDHYEENFRIIMETLFGNNYQFTGKTFVEVTEFKTSATEENVKYVQEKIEDLGIKDVSVSKSEQGLTLSIENINFRADSAVLEESEKEKLNKIIKILENFSENDLLISGHTARVGSEESCQILSEMRAQSVAEFLLSKNVRKENHIFTQGFGSKIPVSSNKTEEGKAKNRRVEITLLDE